MVFGHSLIHLVKLVALSAILAPHQAFSEHEKQYQEWLCSAWQQEAHVGQRLRADCVIGNVAVEIDWSHKWAEGIGQALFYAQRLNMRPGLILVCHVDTSESACLNHKLATVETLAAWALPFTLWECGHLARELRDCQRSEYPN